VSAVADKWIAATLDRLATQPACGYVSGHPPAAEPTALLALALVAHGRIAAAKPALKWLVQLQAADGSVGVRPGEPKPGWPTAIAVCAWQAALKAEAHGAETRLPAGELRGAIESAVDWLLKIEGMALAPSPAMGHDPSIIGWPWVVSTHSWLEPTAWAVMALRAIGLPEHPRTVDGLRLIEDRILPEGGCNYGNTSVLGQVLRPHLEPSGLALIALGDRAVSVGKIVRSCRYLTETLNESTAAISLSYGLMGLAAQGRMPEAAPEWLEAACARTLRRDGNNHALALLLLAASGSDGPLIAPEMAR
jgi:hypothetical protein